MVDPPSSMLETQGEEALDWVMEKLGMAKKKAPPPPIYAPKQDLGDVRSRELQLWHTWNNGGRKPKDLTPLLNSMKPLIMKKKNELSRAEVPLASIEHNLEKQVLQAFKKYDPNKGKLNSFVGFHLKHGGRYVNSLKNTARISENISDHIGRFNAAKADLTEKLGHEPDTHTLWQTMNKSKPIALKTVIRLGKEQRKGLYEISGEGGILGQGGTQLNARDAEVAELIYPELTKEEKIIHEYIYGLNGKPVITESGKLAKKLNWHVSKVSRKKTSIMNKMQPYLND